MNANSIHMLQEKICSHCLPLSAPLPPLPSFSPSFQPHHFRISYCTTLNVFNWLLNSIRWCESPCKLMSRIPYCFSLQINDQVASAIIAQLLYLQGESSKSTINMYINSPGEASYLMFLGEYPNSSRSFPLPLPHPAISFLHLSSFSHSTVNFYHNILRIEFYYNYIS